MFKSLQITIFTENTEVMNQDELSKRIINRGRLEQLEQKPAAPYDPCNGMADSEVRNYARFLFSQIQEKDQLQKEMHEDLKDIKEQLKLSNQLAGSQARTIEKLHEAMELRTKEWVKKMDVLLKENSDLRERLAMAKGVIFKSSKSQKGTKMKKEDKGKNDGRDDFDGTPSSLSTEQDAASEPRSSETSQDQDKATCADEKQSVYHGACRKGWKYNKAEADEMVVHKSDRKKLPEGSVLLSVKTKVIRQVVSKIIEHQYEVLKYRDAHGKIHEVYIPLEDDAEGTAVWNDIVPGTHITSELLSYIAFNQYLMASPGYRESSNRLADMGWITCRQNLINWMDKGAEQLKKLMPALKKMALQDGANVNVDETWARYQTHFGHKKAYMWCLVNRKENIVIFFYENTADENGCAGKHGGRGRTVLKDFLGSAKLKSLQSDGYNVYMYLDDELLDVSHLCCLAHARAKFKYALEQGCEKAGYFLKRIGKLYAREDEYRRSGLSAEDIKAKRNDADSSRWIQEMWTELYELLALPEASVSDLMRKALNYLRAFWEQLFRYREDGEYTIDNLAAERAIRPFTNQRKNSNFFCSVKGAVNSAIYNTFIATCKQVGISFRDYFKRLLREMKTGRTDYENLLPMTIGINQ